MSAFTAPVDDILFGLRHIAEAGRIEGWDDETASDILHHFAQFAEGVIAPLNEIGDEQGARFENGRVRMPEGFAEAYQQLTSDGWQGLTAPEGYGGMGVSHVVASAVSEVFSGANHSLQMVCNLVPGAITTLLQFGSKAQCDTWVPKLASGDALSTMCLTEPGAGSDLSMIRTQARREADGWRLDGEKIFISGGDQDMSNDIMHLVLACSGTAQDGIRGLSLFLCPRQAGAKVTRIEEKMGLHASPTCQMVFEGAQAELVGEEGAGLQAMFTVMNHARLDVALQGVAHAARAAGLARSYAAERKQGRTVDGAPAVLADHADVQRMLDRQDILAMSARAMCQLTLVEIETGGDPGLIEILTSLCKVYGSEAGTQSADLGMQIMGGYGYLTEYGMEQIWRDSRICAIYEGANGIHIRSLVTRGLRAEAADAFDAFVSRFFYGEPPTALHAWRALRHELETLVDRAPHAHRYYVATASLFEQAIWKRFEQAAHHHSDRDRILHLAQTVQGMTGR